MKIYKIWLAGETGAIPTMRVSGDSIEILPIAKPSRQVAMTEPYYHIVIKEEHKIVAMLPLTAAIHTEYPKEKA